MPGARRCARLAPTLRGDPGWPPPSSPRERDGASRRTRPSRSAPAPAARRARPSRAASHREWAPAADRRDPVELLEEQAATRVPGARADPLRPDARVAVHLLPRRRVPDGRRPRRPAAHRARTSSSAATRTSPTSASSPRPTGGSCSASTTSTRRCPGPFEWDVKRLAASFAVAGRDRGFDDEAARRDRPRGAARRTARRCAEFAAMRNARHLVRAPRRRRDRRPRSARTRARKAAAALRGATSPRRAAKDSMQGARPSCTDDGRRRAADRRRPAADHADRGRCCRRRARTARGRRRAQIVRDYRQHARRATGAGCSSASATSTPRARSSASAASARAPGSCCSLGRDDDDPLFLQFKEAQASVLEPFLGASEFAQPRPARRRGPAADAGGERHHARLDHASTRLDGERARLLRPPALGREGLGAGRADEAARRWSATPTSAAGRSRAPTRARATAIAIAAYLGGRRHVRPRDRRRSPRPTPTRTSATTPRSQAAVASGRLTAEAPV